MSMNRGDTACLMLNFKMNGSDLVEGAYQEIELQLNPQGNFNAVRKTLSDGDITWGTVTYMDGEIEKTFTGYICSLSQDETFTLSDGKTQYQLRILVNDEVGSSAIGEFSIGEVLSAEVLK